MHLRLLSNGVIITVIEGLLKISWKDKVTNVEVLKADEGRFALNEEHKKEEA